MRRAPGLMRMLLMRMLLMRRRFPQMFPRKHPG